MSLGLALALLGCSESEPDPKSNVTNGQAGSGGLAGAAGSVSFGLGGSAGAASTAGVGGGANAGAGSGSGGTTNGDAGAHICGGAPEPACPAKPLTGTVVADNAAEWATLEGVTEVTGDLYLMSPLGLDTLSCLEKVGGALKLDFFAEDAEAGLRGLRNLRSVGSAVDIRADERLDVDCGFSRLTSVGGGVATGGAVNARGPIAGHLDLSALKVVQHLRVEGTSLSKVTLPNNTTLTLGQLLLVSNEGLSEVSGFSGITFKNDGALVEGAYSVKITDNPLLPECRARELAQLLIAAGAPESGVSIMNNLPCAQ